MFKKYLLVAPAPYLFVLLVYPTSVTIEYFIDIKASSHKSINVNRLNSMNKDVNVKISSSQVHAEFWKIVLRKVVL